MFQITEGKGFFLSFPNGWGVSVQFGAGNYCDHHGDRRENHNKSGGPGFEAASRGVFKSATAEVAACHTDSRWYDFEADKPGLEGCSVLAYQTPEQVAAIIAKISAL